MPPKAKRVDADTPRISLAALRLAVVVVSRPKPP